MRGERLFVAAPLVPAAVDELGALLPTLPGRRVVPDKWHFTLRFLGDTAAGVRDRVIHELQTERFGSVFPVRLAGLGAFPKASHARVLWVGVEDGADRLTLLAQKVEHACARAGVRGDERPYSPHLTVSRLEPPRDVRRLLSVASVLALTTDIEEVVLMRSRLGHGPPRYDALVRFPLSTAE